MVKNRSIYYEEKNFNSGNNNDDHNKIYALLDSENNRSMKSLLDFPVPDSIIFYHNGIQRTFDKGTDNFNKIIMLNNKRDDRHLGALETAITNINDYLKNTDILEYKYENYNSIYFNLTKDEKLKNDGTIDSYIWVYVDGYPEVFNKFLYVGLRLADELTNYIYSLQ